MFQYLVRRILWAIVLFLTITVVAYVIFFIIPADPAKLACGQRASPDCIRNATQSLGLDKPVYVQYGRFLSRLVIHQDLGKSYFNRQSVNETVMNAAPVTASLVLGGAVLWMLIALPVPAKDQRANMKFESPSRSPDIVAMGTIAPPSNS